MHEPNVDFGVWGTRLDALEEAVFGGEAGKLRAKPLFERHDRIVGRSVPGDPDYELHQTGRADWVFCEARIEVDGAPSTWAHQAAAGRVPGVAPAPWVATLAGSVAGLFEVWTGTSLQLHDCWSGLVCPLVGDMWVEATGRNPVALWEARVVLLETGAALVRRPIDWPLAALSAVRSAREQQWAIGGPVDPLPTRKRRLAYGRARGADPRHFFRGI